MTITGNRYLFSNKYLPHFKPWVQDFVGIDFSKVTPKQSDIPILPPILNHAFLEELGTKNLSRRSFMKWERINHSHGATLQEVFIIRHGEFKRTVDVVVYPATHEQVEVSARVINRPVEPSQDC